MGSKTIESNVSVCVVNNEPEKKKRSRKKMLYESIRKQMEFYFSAANLAKDRWLKMKLEQNECIHLTEFLKFNKIRNLTTDVNELIKALRKSDVLVVTEDLQVKRSMPVTYKEDEDSCVLYIEQVPPDADHEWLSNIFSRYGPIDYVSIPKYKISNKCKGFAFIEFSNAESAERAIEDYKESGNYLSTEIAPEELMSIATFDDHKCDGGVTNKSEKSTLLTESSCEENKVESKKRKMSNDSDTPLECKKMKVCEDEVAETTDDDRKEKDKTLGSEPDDGNTDELKKKKNRKKKSKKKKYSISSETLALQILSKKDWKRLRNKYLNMQREKMKLLKRHLSQSQKRTAEASKQNGKRKEPSVAPTENNGASQYESFIPATIVKIVFDTPLVEVKQIKNEIRANPTVKYVDIKEGDNEIYVRLESSEAASSFCQNATWTNIEIIKGKEETKYWEKVKKNREEKMSQSRKKERGKDKLMKKAEKVLGKHIIFDDI